MLLSKMSGFAAAALLLSLGVAPGPPAPAFALESITGRTMTLQQHRGRVVVLNFWATWCPPCRTEIPWLMQLQERFPDRLAVVGVAMDDEGRRVVAPWVERERFLVGTARRPVTYPILLGSDAVARAYKVESLPATFLIDRHGVEVQRIDGPFELGALETAVRALLTNDVSRPAKRRSRRPPRGGN